MELQPVDHDPFAGGQTFSKDGITIRTRGGSGPTLEPVDHDPFATDFGGIAKQAGVGVAKGVIAIPGLPGDAQQLAKKAGDWISEHLPSMPDTRLGKFLREESAKTAEHSMLGGRGDLPGSYELPTSQDIQGAVEKVTGEFRKPQNQVEADAETAGEFIPSALAGPGSFIRKLVTQAAVPAAASITAGRYSDQNPYVKALAGFLAGGAGAVLSGPRSVENVLRGKIPASVTEQDITRAGQLIEHAQSRGVNLTWPEALTRVSGQPVLTDTQRIIESHGQTRPQMQQFFADRAQQLERAGQAEMNNSLGQASQSPSMIGPEASQIAESTLNRVRASINRATRPSYDAAGQTLVPRDLHAQAMNDPLFARTLNEVRTDPELNAYLHGMSDRSVAVYDAVKQRLEQRSRNLSQPTNPDASAVGSSITGSLAGEVRDTAIDASRSAHGLPSPYETALQQQADLRREYLEPLQRGPLGKLAETPDTKRAINALFPSNPLPASEGEIRDAIGALVQQRPRVAEQLVRAHAEMVFNEAFRELQGGANQFAGAKFAKAIAGNSQQRANLRAAIETLPNGAERWQGFEHLLDIMAATGSRQPKGSLTAFNELEVQAMSNSGLASLAAKGASPGKWMSFANDTFKAWSLGRNLDQIARIITDPGSGNALRQIVRIPPGSDRALVMAGRLIAQAGASTTDQRTKSEK